MNDQNQQNQAQQNLGGNKMITYSVIGILGFIVLMFLFAQFRARQLSAEGHGIVVVNSAAIISQEVAKFANDPNATADSDKALKDAQAISLKLHDALQSYANNGYIVINSKATLGYPAGVDKTNDVARAIGVNMPEGIIMPEGPAK